MDQQTRIISGIAICLCMALGACNRTGDNPKPIAGATSASPGEGKSVALPPANLPASDAAIPPSAPVASTTSNDEKQSQAVPKELSKQQESTSMPMAGQVNNHSVPDTKGAKQ
ncbi:MAG: hypothetical protein JWR22_4034 [Herminiimonas sp.]|nr:hypothetical protein [Herminiimonas sp.]